MAKSATALAKELLEAGLGGLEELRIHEFEDDEEAHGARRPRHPHPADARHAGRIRWMAEGWMSHDFAFWDSQEPLEDAEADAIYAALAETGASERVQPSPKIALLARDIASRWPVPAAGNEDDWPLASPPDLSESHLIVFVVPSRLWDVWPELGQFAKENELVMYDPQQRTVFLPPRLSRKRTRVRAKKKRSSKG